MDANTSAPTRWGRSLRLLRAKRGLTDVYFGEPGSLGLEFAEAPLAVSNDGGALGSSLPSGESVGMIRTPPNQHDSSSTTGGGRKFVVQSLSPPSSALDLKPRRTALLAVGENVLSDTTSAKALGGWMRQRPINCVFVQERMRSG